MKTLSYFLLIALGILGASLAEAQVTLTPLKTYELTPNETDSIGAFCRLMYHPARKRFYSVYAARPAGSALPPGQLTSFAWREFDSNLVFTGRKGTLSGLGNIAGDYAITQIGTTYFHLTFSASSYKLSKYNEDFTLLGNASIPLDTKDSKADQLMNFANNRLVIGSVYEPTATTTPTLRTQQASWTPRVHLFQYDTTLKQVAEPLLLDPIYYAWGASALFVNNKYYIISSDSLPRPASLYAFEYDVNWKYLNRYLLSNDGQWSQGVLWDGKYYYVAYHTGGEHRSGNVMIGVYDANWKIVTSKVVTSYNTYPPPAGINTNANRPFLTRVGNTLYISYDAEVYTYTNGPPFYTFTNSWQSRVASYQISTSTGVTEEKHREAFSVSPNPAQDLVTVQFILPKAKRVSLKMFNALGQEVAQIIDAEMGAGEHTVAVSTANLPLGSYFLRLYAPSFSQTKPVQVIR